MSDQQPDPNLDATLAQGLNAVEGGLPGKFVPLETTEFGTTGTFIPDPAALAEHYRDFNAKDLVSSTTNAEPPFVLTGTETPPPWPPDHRGHWWSGWPGAYCMRCGCEDPMEIAMADNWYDPVEGKWDTDEHRLQVKEAQQCPADQMTGDVARDMIIGLRGGIPLHCNFCGTTNVPDNMHPEEAGEWACITCIERWRKENNQ